MKYLQKSDWSVYVCVNERIKAKQTFMYPWLKNRTLEAHSTVSQLEPLPSTSNHFFAFLCSMYIPLNNILFGYSYFGAVQ